MVLWTAGGIVTGKISRWYHNSLRVGSLEPKCTDIKECEYR